VSSANSLTSLRGEGELKKKESQLGFQKWWDPGKGGWFSKKDVPERLEKEIRGASKLFLAKKPTFAGVHGWGEKKRILNG